MRKLAIFIWTIASIGIIADHAYAREITVGKHLLHLICGGPIIVGTDHCVWCNAIKCYTVEKCGDKTCTVLVYHENSGSIHLPPPPPVQSR
jgi:hypothetical protein